MDAVLFNYIIIYSIVFGLINLIRDIVKLEEKSLGMIVKTVLIDIIFIALFFIICVAIIVILQMGFDQMEFIVKNDLYYMGVPVVASLFVFLSK